MLAKRIILSLLLTGLLLVLYFQRVFVDSPEPDHATAQELIDLFTPEPATVNKISEHVNPVKSNDTENVGRQPESTTASNNLKKINIFGRVVDEYRQPIENVLISEEHFFYYTRSDSDGFYRLAVELPKHRFPLLKFLRSGYEGNSFDIVGGESGVDSQVELNVTLLESVESIKVNGWIGNETGENLSRQKISIYSRTNQGLKNISRTVISDENGEFVFEAVKPDADYELDVLSSAQYAPYSIQDLILNRTTPRLNIILKKLKFIQLSGMFVGIEGTPVPNFEIDIMNISTGIHLRRIASDSSGFFSLDNFPAGDVIFFSKAPEHLRITGLTLTENEYRHLTLVVDKGSYQISGWVSDQNGVTVKRAMVMFDAEVVREGIKSVSNRSTVTNNNGYFQFEELANTQHQITIYAKGFSKKELLHRFNSPSSDVYITLSPQ